MVHRTPEKLEKDCPTGCLDGYQGDSFELMDGWTWMDNYNKTPTIHTSGLQKRSSY